MPAADLPTGGASRLSPGRLPAGYRILYTGVLLFFVAGYGTGLAKQHLRAGLNPKGAAEWILGNEDDLETTRFLFPKPPHEVLDEVWRRTLSDVLPVIVVLALLFRSGARAGARGTLATVLLATALTDMSAPWLLHAFGARWGGTAWIAQVGLAVAAASAILLCLLEMWRPHGTSSESGRGQAPGVPA